MESINLREKQVKKIVGIIAVVIGFIAVVVLAFYLGSSTGGHKIKIGDDVKGTGEFQKKEVVYEEGPTFRMKLNCTPVIEDERINIRLESPEGDNEIFAFVTEVYITEKKNEDDTVTVYENPKLIYTSPVLYEGENIEYGTLEEEVEQGYYSGRALYYVYDLNGNFVFNTAAKLTINAR